MEFIPFLYLLALQFKRNIIFPCVTRDVVTNFQKTQFQMANKQMLVFQLFSAYTEKQTEQLILTPCIRLRPVGLLSGLVKLWLTAK